VWQPGRLTEKIRSRKMTQWRARKEETDVVVETWAAGGIPWVARGAEDREPRTGRNKKKSGYL